MVLTIPQLEDDEVFIPTDANAGRIIQLHEFEGLLFSDRRVFDDNFEDHEFSDYKYLEETEKEKELLKKVLKMHCQ